MPHKFEIRFARSAGLAAILEAPTNMFRWTGSGSLSIDAQGISVAVRRGLLSLLARNRTRRIPTANLKEVFREGDALRVDFATDEIVRASLRFWAHDRNAAARIVQLMPTSRTVETEEQSAAARFRVNWRAVMLLIAAFAALACILTAMLYERVTIPAVAPDSSVPSPTVAQPSTGALDAPVSSTPAELPAAGAVPAVSAPPARVRAREVVELVYSEPAELAPGFVDAPFVYAPEATGPAVPDESMSLVTPQDIAPTIVFRVRVSTDGVVPIVPGMAAYREARRELDLFLSESQQAIDVASWWSVTVRINTIRASADPALRPLLDSELAASRAWRNYLSNYDAYGANSDRAQADLEFARILTNRTRQYVD